MEDPSEIDGITPGITLKTFRHGTVLINFTVGTTTFTVKLTDVKYAPDAPNSLISIGCLMDHGHSAVFTSLGVQFKARSGIIFGKGKKVGRMYRMRIGGTSGRERKDFAAVTGARTMDKWHRILGHVNLWTIKP
jgi:hypothetical protein